MIKIIALFISLLFFVPTPALAGERKSSTDKQILQVARTALKGSDYRVRECREAEGMWRCSTKRVRGDLPCTLEVWIWMPLPNKYFALPYTNCEN